MHKFTSPDSQIISEVRYWPNTNKMFIEFQTGLVYSYKDVSMSRYVYFRDSDSKGTYFAYRIKPNYVATRMPHGFPRYLKA